MRVPLRREQRMAQTGRLVPNTLRVLVLELVARTVALRYATEPRVLRANAGLAFRGRCWQGARSVA